MTQSCRVSVTSQNSLKTLKRDFGTPSFVSCEAASKCKQQPRYQEKYLHLKGWHESIHDSTVKGLLYKYG